MSSRPNRPNSSRATSHLGAPGRTLTQYQQTEQNLALSTLSSAYGMAPKVSPMSPSSMFVSPGQALQTQESNNALVYNSQQAANNAQAAASNYNSSLLGGAVSGVGNMFGAYALQGALKQIAPAQNPQTPAAVAPVRSTPGANNLF